MLPPIDYTLFDRPEVTFLMFYPQRVWSPPPAGAIDHMAPVAEGVAVSARLFTHDPRAPTILFFHGNGEVACQYDDIAPAYAQAGANLFAADFRGYGRSGGSPSFSTMIDDARRVFEYAREALAQAGFGGPLYVKGRSLGCQSAVEVAARYQDELAGLITESGAASLKRMTRRFDLGLEGPALETVLRLHDEKVRSIRLPLLVIHGELDDLVPVENAIDLYDTVSSQDKRIEIIPGAGHNDLLWVGPEQYFEAIRRFLKR